VKVALFLDFVRALGIKLTRAQRVLVSVCCDGVQPSSFRGVDRHVARRLFGDVESVPAELRTVVLWLKGARIGGTWLAALRTLHLALTLDLGSLAAGEAAFVLLVGPDTRLPRQALRYVIGALKAHPALAPLLVAESSESATVRRQDGREVTFEVLPATKGGSAVRGRSIVAAMMTEAAFFRDRDFAVNDAEVYQAILPRVLEGGQLILESTPWAEGSGLVWELFDANHGQPATCVAAHCPTLLMRDDARTRGIVERERARDPENCRREFDAEFAAAGTGFFFDADSLRLSIDPALSVRVSPQPGAYAFAGGDLALYVDAAALVVVHRFDRAAGLELQIVETLERRPRKGAPLDLATITREFAEMAGRHGTTQILADHHLLPAAGSLLPPGFSLIPCPPGQLGKTETHVRVRDLFRAGAIKMPEAMSGLRDQLAKITSTPGAGGGLSIKSPRRGGTHGDLASACVLALYFASVGAVDDGVEWAIRMNSGSYPQRDVYGNWSYQRPGTGW